MRQWGSRYAIRAGRNLPDKEFRSRCCSTWSHLLSRGEGSGVGHFCHPLHVAMQFGLYLRLPALVQNRASGVKSLRIPLRLYAPRPFLLIACTPRIVTAVLGTASSGRYSGVPANSQILLRQRSHLRTVIVTAAVYRGFGSQLRLAANRSP